MILQECKFGFLFGILLSTLAIENSTQAQAYTPDFAWAAGANARGNDVYGSAIAVDAAGNSYVCGNFSGDVNFGGIVLTNIGFFLVKFDPRGQMLWVKQKGDFGAGRDRSAVATDSQGNIYVTGGVSGDLLLAKYGSDGNLIWFRQTGSDVLDYGRGVAVDKSGNVCVTGVFHLTGLDPVDPALQRIYIAKYSADGDMLWEKKIAGKGGTLNLGKGIGADGEGNVYVSGYFQDTNLFGPNTISGYGSFLAKYDGAGNLLWATKAGEDGRVEGMAVDEQGNSYLVGYFVATITFGTNSLINTNHEVRGFVVKYDSSGNALWAKPILVSPPGWLSNVYVFPNRIAVDRSGNCYLTGYFSSIAIFGTIQVADYSTAHGYSANPDGFVAKCDSDGSFLWARDIGLGHDTGIGVAIDSQGNTHLTGNFGSELTLGKTTLVTSGPSMFVTQLPAVYLTSPNLNQTTGKLQFVLVAQKGSECAIEFSTDLAHWFGLVTNQIPAAGFLELNYGVLSGGDRGFYRARSLVP